VPSAPRHPRARVAASTTKQAGQSAARHAFGFLDETGTIHGPRDPFFAVGLLLCRGRLDTPRPHLSIEVLRGPRTLPHRSPGHALLLDGTALALRREPLLPAHPRLGLHSRLRRLAPGGRVHARPTHAPRLRRRRLEQIRQLPRHAARGCTIAAVITTISRRRGVGAGRQCYRRISDWDWPDRTHERGTPRNAARPAPQSLLPVAPDVLQRRAAPVRAGAATTPTLTGCSRFASPRACRARVARRGARAAP